MLSYSEALLAQNLLHNRYPIMFVEPESETLQTLKMKLIELKSPFFNRCFIFTCVYMCEHMCTSAA